MLASSLPAIPALPDFLRAHSVASPCFLFDPFSSTKHYLHTSTHWLVLCVCIVLLWPLQRALLIANFAQAVDLPPSLLCFPARRTNNSLPSPPHVHTQVTATSTSTSTSTSTGHRSATTHGPAFRRLRLLDAPRQ